VDADGNIDCDYYGCSSALTADDVANGICHYDSTGRALTNDQIEFLGAGDEPFREVCAHWSKETHTLMESVNPPPRGFELWCNVRQFEWCYLWQNSSPR
jgi:hypothetical protein